MFELKSKIKSLYLSRRYETLIRYLRAYHEIFVYEKWQGHPAIRFDGQLFIGFDNASADESIYRFIRFALPSDMNEEFYRVARDVITRYIFPHMMPTLKPLCRGYKTLSGFHGQHKDAIPDIADIALREKLSEIFMPKHDDVIVDCGAYTGYGELRVSRHVPNGVIYAVEAKKDCYDALCNNIAVNAITNVVPLNRAVYKDESLIDLNTGELQNNSLVLDVKTLHTTDRATSYESVKGLSLDRLASEKNLKKVDFISLTLNGAEVEALDGMTEILTGYSPRLRLAGWYFRGDRPIAELCAEKLRCFGYRVVIGKFRSVYAFKEKA